MKTWLQDPQLRPAGHPARRRWRLMKADRRPQDTAERARSGDGGVPRGRRVVALRLTSAARSARRTGPFPVKPTFRPKRAAHCADFHAGRCPNWQYDTPRRERGLPLPSGDKVSLPLCCMTTHPHCACRILQVFGATICVAISRFHAGGLRFAKAMHPEQVHWRHLPGHHTRTDAGRAAYLIEAVYRFRGHTAGEGGLRDLLVRWQSTNSRRSGPSRSRCRSTATCSRRAHAVPLSG